MSGWEQNDAPDSLHGADLDEAARRLADVLDEEDADVLVGYDWHGGYGHPDHVRVHHLVHRAAELAARPPRLLESTMNRTLISGLIAAGRDLGADLADFDPDAPMDDGNPLGTPEDEITWRVDVTAYLGQRACGVGGPPLPGDRHRGLLVDAAGGLRGGVRARALHRAGRPRPDPRRLAVCDHAAVTEERGLGVDVGRLSERHG